MSNFEAWIADCHFSKIEGEGEYHCQAAVWANSAETLRSRLKTYAKEQGYTVLWTEEVLSAIQYLHCHGNSPQIGALARSVHDGHHVELSKLVTIGAEGEVEPENYLTITEHEITPLPDQTGIPFWDQEWIAPDLKTLLFGELEEKPEVRTYFIVDSILRKKITGVFDLDAIDVPIQCLFKGDAAEELKESAPYLIDMTLPDGALEDRDLVPSFHKDFFKKHWGQNTGIFIRTTAPMDEVWGHFRKFTRIQVEEDKRWVYFRFWDPRITPSYFDSIKDIPEKSVQWVTIRRTAHIKTIIGNQTDSEDVFSITPKWDNLEGFFSIGQPMLSDAEMKGFERYKLEKFDRETAVDLFIAYPSMGCSKKQFQELTKIVRIWSCEYGITGERDITRLVHLSIALGAYFPNDIRFLNLAAILHDTSQPPNVRVKNCVAIAKKWLATVWEGHSTKEMEMRLAQCIGQSLETYSNSKTLSLLAHQLNPQYVDSIDNETLNVFARQCTSICDAHKINGNYARICYIICALRYGQNFIDDPIHSTIAEYILNYETDVELQKILTKLFNTYNEIAYGTG